MVHLGDDGGRMSLLGLCTRNSNTWSEREKAHLVSSGSYPMKIYYNPFHLT